MRVRERGEGGGETCERVVQQGVQGRGRRRLGWGVGGGGLSVSSASSSGARPTL